MEQLKYLLDTNILSEATKPKPNLQVLVTRNTDDFIRFSGLQLENWFDEA